MSLPINEIICCDCLEALPGFPSNSIDMILSDLPYGVTQNSKDVKLDLVKLWDEYKRVIKPGGNIVLTSQFPFTLELIETNRAWFRYDLIWSKGVVTGFLNANRQPLRTHEHVLIFYEKLGTYNPQKRAGKKNHGKNSNKKNKNYGDFDCVDSSEKLGPWKHPKSILEYDRGTSTKLIHPTQKPVRLFEFLVKSYSNENEIVLDTCIGSGTTAVACVMSNRKYIGIDIDQKWVDYTNKRLLSTPGPLSKYMKLTEINEISISKQRKRTN